MYTGLILITSRVLTGELNFLELLPLIFVFTLPCNLFIFGVNDYFDKPSDDLNKRKGGAFGAIHTDKEVQKLILPIIFGGLTTIITVLYFYSIQTFLLVLLSLFNMWAYSSPPFRFKGIPILDFLTGGFLAGISLVFVTAFALKTQISFQSFVDYPILVIIPLSFLTSHIFGALLDYQADKKSGTNTTPVYFGKRKAIWILLFIILSPFLFLEFNFISAAFILYLLGIYLGYTLNLYPEKMSYLISQYSILGLSVCAIFFAVFYPWVLG